MLHFATAAFLLLSSAARLAAQQPEPARLITVGPMRVAIPSAWPPGPESGPNTVSYVIPGGAGSVVTMTAARGNGEEKDVAHRMIWGAYTKPFTRSKPLGSGQAGQFLWSEMIAAGPNQQVGWHRLYSTASGGMHIVVLLVAAEPDFARARPIVERILNAATAGNAREPVVQSTTAPAGDEVPIAEAHVRVEIRASSLTSNVTTDHILFFANGIVAREGVITGPRECYVLYDVRNLTKLPFNYGRWQEDKAAGIVRVQWQEGPPWTLQRAGGRLSLDGKALLVLRPIDGLKPAGAYSYRYVTGAMSQLELRADGQFTANNLLESMSCASQARPGALSGSGTYEIRKWTLILRFTNGSVTMLPMYIEADQDLQRVARFFLNGHDFTRVR